MDIERRPDAWTVPGFSKQLCVSRSKAYELVGRGDVESIMIDGCRRITDDALKAYLRKLQETQKQASKDDQSGDGPVGGAQALRTSPRPVKVTRPSSRTPNSSRPRTPSKR